MLEVKRALRYGQAINSKEDSPMTNAQHTPGPWVTDKDVGHEAVLGADGALVADCAIFGLHVNRSQEINKANARLIAAAPELLEALERMADVAEKSGLTVFNEEFTALANARYVIAKATGQAA